MMLIDDTTIIWRDPLRAIFAKVNDMKCERLHEGVYEIGHWLSSPVAQGWHDDMEDFESYGVADNVEQILARIPQLEGDPERTFIVTVVEVRREDQPDMGGWRYHKWGEYIGTQNPEHEYLYDDKHIDSVLTYHIYEREDATC